MKCRGIVVIDYDLTAGGFKAAAAEQTALEDLISNFVKGRKAVVHSEVDLRDRRGDAKPDIKKVKVG
jgi:hypothetical protein